MGTSESRFGGQEWSAGPHILTDPGNAGAISVAFGNASVEIVTAAPETRTIAAPTAAGQTLLVALKTDGGDCTITVASTVNQNGDNSLIGADAGDLIKLESGANGASYEWKVAHNDGWAVSTV